MVVAHRKGIIHRDIKPENIFLAEYDQGVVVPKVIDYGIALEPQKSGNTTFRWRMGSWPYMAPEQFKEDCLDARVDVWAVGIVLFELLAGRCPFDATSPFVMATKHFAGVPAPRLVSIAPHVPEALAVIVERAFDRDLGHRYRSMDVFLRALLKFIQGADPGFAGRHPTLPPLDELELGSEDRPAESARQPMSLRSVRPVARPDMEWYVDVSAPTVAAPDHWAALAEEALRVNALDVAIEHAELAIQSDGGRLGQMRLVQAIAGCWLGRFGDAETWARQAIAELPRASSGWRSAVGQMAASSAPWERTMGSRASPTSSCRPGPKGGRAKPT